MDVAPKYLLCVRASVTNFVLGVGKYYSQPSKTISGNLCTSRLDSFIVILICSARIAAFTVENKFGRLSRLHSADKPTLERNRNDHVS